MKFHFDLPSPLQRDHEAVLAGLAVLGVRAAAARPPWPALAVLRPLHGLGPRVPRPQTRHAAAALRPAHQQQQQQAGGEAGGGRGGGERACWEEDWLVISCEQF